jgi:hypoxanthine phosphoribosyltransferase
MKKLSKPFPRKGRTAGAVKIPAGDELRIVYTAAELRSRVRELAKQISRDYEGKTLHVVGILDNCFVFMSDLIRSLTVPVVCHFVRPEVYDTAPGGVPMREIKYTPPVQAAGKDVLLLDGILQSGLTLDHLYRYILGQQASSVRTAILIEKTDERKVAVSTDYVGFKATGGFLVGYGLGRDGLYRNLPYVAAVG